MTQDFCPFCDKPIFEPGPKSESEVSIGVKGGEDFVRAHKRCYEKAPVKKLAEIQERIIDENS